MRGSGRVAKPKKARPSINYIYPDLVDQAIREKYPAIERLQQPQSVASLSPQEQSSFADNQVLSSTTSSSLPNLACEHNEYIPLLPDDQDDPFNFPIGKDDGFHVWSPLPWDMRTPSEAVGETKSHETVFGEEFDLLHAAEFPDCDKVDELFLNHRFL